MILLVVRKAGWQRSPWHSWTREFLTEEEFLAWFHDQPEDSYVKKVASQPEYRDKCFRLVELTTGKSKTDELLAPWSPAQGGIK
jgi:hypothetical protein